MQYQFKVNNRNQLVHLKKRKKFEFVYKYVIIMQGYKNLLTNTNATFRE